MTLVICGKQWRFDTFTHRRCNYSAYEIVLCFSYLRISGSSYWTRRQRAWLNFRLTYQQIFRQDYMSSFLVWNVAGTIYIQIEIFWCWSVRIPYITSYVFLPSATNCSSLRLLGMLLKVPLISALVWLSHLVFLFSNGSQSAGRSERKTVLQPSAFHCSNIWLSFQFSSLRRYISSQIVRLRFFEPSYLFLKKRLLRLL